MNKITEEFRNLYPPELLGQFDRVRGALLENPNAIEESARGQGSEEGSEG